MAEQELAHAPDKDATGKIRPVVMSAHKWGGDGKRPLFRKIKQVLSTRHPEVLKAFGGNPNVAAAWIKNNWYYLRGQDPPPTRGKKADLSGDSKGSRKMKRRKKTWNYSQAFELDEDTAHLTQGATHLLFLDGAKAEKSEDGLIWKDVIRTGSWAAGPNGKPLQITEELLSHLVAAYEEEAWEHVTLPLTHADKVHENTGFVRQLLIKEDPDNDGEYVLRAGMEFTEPDVAEKVERGTIANTSCGIQFNFKRPSDGQVFPAVLKHVCLTNAPWINGLRPFGTEDQLAASMNEEGTLECETYMLNHETGMHLLGALRGIVDSLQQLLSDPRYRDDVYEEGQPEAGYSQDPGTGDGDEELDGDEDDADDKKLPADAAGNTGAADSQDPDNHENTGGGETHMSKKNDETETLQLSQEELDARIEAALELDRANRASKDEATQMELSRLRVENHQRWVKEKVGEYEKAGHAPAVLKEVKDMLLADEARDEILTLSQEDGGELKLSAADVIDRVLSAVPASVLTQIALSQTHERPDDDTDDLDEKVDAEWKAIHTHA